MIATAMPPTSTTATHAPTTTAVVRRRRGCGRGPLSAVGGEIGGDEPNERGGGAGVPDGVGVVGRIAVAPGWNTGCTPELRIPEAATRSVRIWSASAYRCRGSLARLRVSTWLTWRVNSSAPASWGTGACWWAIAISTSEPRYGGAPVSVAQNRQPSA